MNRFASGLRQTRDTDLQNPLLMRNEGRYIDMGKPPASDSHRHFALQPILTPKRRVIGYEALFRDGWEDAFSGDPDNATRIMIDNWLLYGFEDLTGGCFTFLNCTRETLVSGLLTLLPRWAVFEILESVEPDREVLRACRNLKTLGYRISLDDFEFPDKMEGFLELADFIKIDFRLSGSKERARLMRRLKGTGAMLIAEKIETEEEFRRAVLEGFELFQGFYFRERASFAMSRDSLNAENCLHIFEALQQPGFAINRLADLIDLEPGIGCRLLRRANWEDLQSPVNSIRDALKQVGKAEFRKLVRLATLTAGNDWNELPSELALLMHDSTVEPAIDDARFSRKKMQSDGPGKILKMSISRRTQT